MRQSAILSLTACVVATAGGRVLAQWIQFDLDTSNRLLLSEVSMNDNEEKDMAVGDFNHDGWDDVVVVRKRPFSSPGPRVDVLLMNDGGVLVDRTDELAHGFLDALTDARDVHVVDLDGDQWEDLVLANTFSQMPSVYMNRGNDAAGQWQGFANESFRIPNITSTGLIQFCAVWSGDISGNGAPDLYFSNYGGGDDVLVINDGRGFFTDETVARLGPLADVAFGTANEIHDVDNDGDLDIVRVSTLGGPGAQIRYNNGDGTFTNNQNIDGISVYMFVMDDFNADGMLDMYLVQDPQDQVKLATAVNPDGPVTYNAVPMTSPRTTGFGGNAHLADLDNDGDLDIGVGPVDVDIQNCGANHEFALLQNPGDGVFVDPWSAMPNQNFHLEPHDFAFVDIDNDGCLDMVMGLCVGWAVLIQTDCAASSAPFIVHDGGTAPFSGYIDPRAESSDGVSLDLGVDHVTMQFSVPVQGVGGGLMTPASFAVTGTGANHPSVVAVDASANPVIELTLSGPLPLQEWTTIIADVEDQMGNLIQNLGDLGPGVDEPDRVDIGFLPADVDQSGTVNPLDALRFKQLVNDIVDPETGVVEDFIDVNRSGDISPLDLLRFKQLINGITPATQSWSGVGMNNPRP